jgi:glutathione synthase
VGSENGCLGPRFSVMALPMDILFVMDPLPRILSDRDTTFELMAAAEKRGHRVFWCAPESLSVQDAHVVVRAEQVTLRPNQVPHYEAIGDRELVLSEIGATLMRKDPPVDAAFMNATLLLQLAAKQGARVYNRPDSLLVANEKLYALNFPAWIPETLVTSSLQETRAFVNKHGRAVLKPIDGNGGRAVFSVSKTDSNIGPIVESLSAEGRRHFIVQKYLPEVALGDKRIILVDGEPLGAINRIPQSGDHRANMHVGGKAVASTLNDREKAMCEALKPSLRRDGLFFVGIDVIGSYLTEVNVTSPTGLQEIRRLCQIDIAPRVIEAIEGHTQK